MLLLMGSVAVAQNYPPVGAAAGKLLFESNKCFDCHRVGAKGSRQGPDLSEIGMFRTTDQLRRAIVSPDDEVLPENRQVRVVTKDGATVVGRLLNHDTFTIQLIDAQDQLRSYVKANLREHTILEKGLMPSYQGKLDAQQVVDIVRYLETLTGDEK